MILLIFLAPINTKATPNEDPLQTKWEKTLSTVNMGTTAALTQKKIAAAAVPSINNKNSNPIPNQASKKVPGKSTQKHTTTIEDDDEEALDNHTSNLKSTNGSDNDSDSNAGPEISVYDDDEEMGDIHLEAAEECDETELG